MAKKDIDFLSDDFKPEEEVVESKPKKETETAASHAIKFSKTEAKRKNLVNEYRGERKVAVSISPFYAPYLGKIHRVIVNGIVVDIPCDGQTYQINETHASHIIAKVKRIDAMISRQKKAGDVKNNFEFSPGELHI